MNLSEIKKDISSKNFAPYYFLHGEEPFFIDKAVELLQNGLMEDHERDFNQTIFYGKDADPSAIIETAKRFPMMAERCGVIVKEGQDFKSSSFEALENLLASPTPTTVTVFAFKGKIDKRRKFFKTLIKAGKTFESAKLYENKIPNWIQDHIGAHGLKINQKATLLLANQLGTNLHKLDDALSKLAVVCPKGSEITPLEIEYNIGISRDYNVFELLNAYSENDSEKVVRIAFHLSNNEKENPPLMISSQLFGFFNKLMIYHYLKDKSKASAAKALGVNPFFVSQYINAARHFSAMRVLKVIDLIRDFDMRFKGKNAGSTSSAKYLNELSLRILRA